MSDTKIAYKITAYATSKALNHINPHLEILLIRYLKKRHNSDLSRLTEPSNLYDAVQTLFGQYAPKIFERIEKVANQQTSN